MEEKTYRFYIRQGDFELDIEGDQAFVESHVEAFLEEEALEAEAKSQKALTAKPAARSRKALPPPKATAKPANVHEDLGALANFMKGARPKTNKDRFLRYVDFLRQQGMADVAAKDVEACFVASRIKAPASPRQYFQILKKQGLLEPSGNWGRWSLTGKGVAAVSKNAKPAKPAARKKGARRKANRRRKAASR